MLDRLAPASPFDAGHALDKCQDRARRHDWFKATILPNEPVLLGYLVRVGLSRSDAEDVVSQSLIRALTARDFDRIDRGRSYLFTIARNLLRDAARRRRTAMLTDIPAHQMENVVDLQPSIEARLTAQQEMERLRAAIETLPLRCRQVFERKRLSHLSMAAIAEELGISVSTAEKHLGKAMRLLSAAMANVRAVDE